MIIRPLRLFFPALVGFALCAALTAAPAGVIEADSRITGVMVYARGAVVTRETTVDLGAGLQAVRFAGLPKSVNPNLLQVAATGSSKATILDVNATETPTETPANERLRELAAQRQAVEAEMEEATDRTKLLEQQRDYLERIKTLATTHAPGETAAPAPTIEQWDRQLAFYADRQAKLAEELRAARRQLEQLRARLETVKAQEEELEAGEDKVSKTVVVRCEVAAPGRFTVRVTYPVDEASWKPVYDVRLTSADKGIQLHYAAMVRQSTGEDWRGVRLQLSTARPALGGRPPVFEPWEVGERAVAAVDTRVVTGQFLKDTGATTNATLLQYTASTEASGVLGNFAGAGNTAPAKAGAVELLAEAGTTEAEVSAGLGSATFTIPFAADVPADNGARKYAIGTTALEGVMNFLAQPKLAPHTYRRARVTHTAAFPFAAGDMNLFLDGAFVSTSALPTVMPGAKFVLNLGVDDGFTVKRKLVNRVKEDTGAFAKRVRITYEFLTTVESHHATAETLVLKDQLPVSRHEKVVVTMVAPAEAQLRKEEEGGQDGAIRRDADGTLSWTLVMKPGEKRELPLKFHIEYPAGFPVAGVE